MDSYYWIALKSIPGVGNIIFQRLVERFGSPERVLQAGEAALASVRGLGPSSVAAIRGGGWRTFAEQECTAAARAGIRIVTLTGEEYPPLLRQISDPPPVLYVRGSLADIEPAVGVVGSRRVSNSGRMITSRLSRELAEQGVTVVSGLARGVDTAAHRGALAGGGRTIGVLGCGLDIVYPRENRDLFAEMAEKGAVVSEFPLGTQPLAENFPRRNRIISGISRGVLVVEAAEQSGSLITAQCALEQGRDVFAIPGNITCSSSRGTNRLIKQGAKLIETVEDILEELPRQGGSRRARSLPPTVSLTAQEATICSLLADAPLHIDDIIVKSTLTVGEVSVILLGLELKGAVTQHPGKYFSVS